MASHRFTKSNWGGSIHRAVKQIATPNRQHTTYLQWQFWCWFSHICDDVSLAIEWMKIDIDKIKASGASAMRTKSMRNRPLDNDATLHDSVSLRDIWHMCHPFFIHRIILSERFQEIMNLLEAIFPVVEFFFDFLRMRDRWGHLRHTTAHVTEICNNQNGIAYRKALLWFLQQDSGYYWLADGNDIHNLVIRWMLLGWWLDGNVIQMNQIQYVRKLKWTQTKSVTFTL